MSKTDLFAETIKAYLDKRAEEDSQFAEKYANSKKNIDNCCTYIINWVRQSKRQGFTDAEIFGQAVHYYDEENIKIGKPIKCEVVVNHNIELTAEDLAKAKQDAITEFKQQALKEMKKKPTPKKKPTKADDNNLMQTLF